MLLALTMFMYLLCARPWTAPSFPPAAHPCLPQELIQVPSPPPPSLRSPAPVIGPDSKYCYYATLSLRVYDLLKCFLQTRPQAFFKHVPPSLITKEGVGVREGIRLQLF